MDSLRTGLRHRLRRGAKVAWVPTDVQSSRRTNPTTRPSSPRSPGRSINEHGRGRPSNAPPPPTFHVGRDSESWVCVGPSSTIVSRRLVVDTARVECPARQKWRLTFHSIRTSDAVVWVKVTTKDRFFDDVARRRQADRETQRRPPGCSHARGARPATEHVTRRRCPRGGCDLPLTTTTSSWSTKGVERRGASVAIFRPSTPTGSRPAAAGGPGKGGEQVLVVLNDLNDSSPRPARDAERARVLSTVTEWLYWNHAPNIKVLMTRSSFSGIGRVPGRHGAGDPAGADGGQPHRLPAPAAGSRAQSHDHVPEHAATAQDCPARRGACTRRIRSKRLNGQPYAVGLGVAILNKLFAYEKMAKEVCEGAGARRRRLRRRARAHSNAGPRLARARFSGGVRPPPALCDELKYVVEYGAGVSRRRDGMPPAPRARIRPWDVARSWLVRRRPPCPCRRAGQRRPP